MLPARRARVSLISLVVLCLAAASLPALASPGRRLDSLEQRKEQVDQQIAQLGRRRGDVAAQLRVLDARRSAAETRVRHLDARLSTLNGKLGTLQKKLSDTQAHLAVVHGELLDMQRRLVRRTDIFTQRATAIYEAGPSAMMDGLLSSNDFGDLIDRYTYYQSALDTDQSLVGEITRLRDGMADRQREVEAKEAKITAAKMEVERTKSEVADARERRKAQLDERRQAVAEKQTLLSRIEASKAAREKAAQELDSEITRVQDIIAAAQAAAARAASPAATAVTVHVGGSGQLSWPVSGPITSGFGMRVDPVTHVYQLHAGIDIGVPEGTAVSAAADGTVVYAGTMTGYGNVVVIDHSGDLSTLYGHLSSYVVARGESVARGQQVAYSGCTGYCTGPHLHFEVRVNGTPVDPLPYLP